MGDRQPLYCIISADIFLVLQAASLGHLLIYCVISRVITGGRKTCLSVGSASSLHKDRARKQHIEVGSGSMQTAVLVI